MDPSAAAGAASAGASRRMGEQWSNVAGKLLVAGDLEGCKQFASQALAADPRTPGADDLHAAASSLLAAQRRRLPNGQPDPYGVLGLDPANPASRRPEAIHSQYDRLSLLLSRPRPDRPSSSAFAEAARLVADAWATLSHPVRKSVIDAELDAAAAVRAYQSSTNLALPHSQSPLSARPTPPVAAPSPRQTPLPAAPSPRPTPPLFSPSPRATSPPVASPARQTQRPVAPQTWPTPPPAASAPRSTAPPPVASPSQQSQRPVVPQSRPTQPPAASAPRSTAPPPVATQTRPTPPLAASAPRSNPPPPVAPQTWSTPPPAAPAPRPTPPPPVVPQTHSNTLQPTPPQTPVATTVPAVKSVATPSSTFWTVCSACSHIHQFDCQYETRKLRCPSCRQPFVAKAMAEPPPIVPGTDMYYCTWGFFPVGFPGCPGFEKMVNTQSSGLDQVNAPWLGSTGGVKGNAQNGMPPVRTPVVEVPGEVPVEVPAVTPPAKPMRVKVGAKKRGRPKGSKNKKKP